MTKLLMLVLTILTAPAFAQAQVNLPATLHSNLVPRLMIFDPMTNQPRLRAFGSVSEAVSRAPIVLSSDLMQDYDDKSSPSSPKTTKVIP